MLKKQLIIAECTPPVLSGGSYAFKSRSNDSGDGSVVYNDVITYTCDVTHTMDASVTSPDLVCGADGSMATLASQNIKCNKSKFKNCLIFIFCSLKS